MSAQTTVARLNRMYLIVARDLALREGVDVAAEMLGMDIPDTEWLTQLDPAEIEEIAEIGLPLVRLRLPERRQWNLLPRESRKGWAISRSIDVESPSSRPSLTSVRSIKESTRIP